MPGEWTPVDEVEWGEGWYWIRDGNLDCTVVEVWSGYLPDGSLGWLFDWSGSEDSGPPGLGSYVHGPINPPPWNEAATPDGEPWDGRPPKPGEYVDELADGSCVIGGAPLAPDDEPRCGHPEQVPAPPVEE